MGGRCHPVDASPRLHGNAQSARALASPLATVPPASAAAINPGVVQPTRTSSRSPVLSFSSSGPRRRRMTSRRRQRTTTSPAIAAPARATRTGTWRLLRNTDARADRAGEAPPPGSSSHAERLVTMVKETPDSTSLQPRLLSWARRSSLNTTAPAPSSTTKAAVTRAAVVNPFCTPVNRGRRSFRVARVDHQRFDRRQGSLHLGDINAHPVLLEHVRHLGSKRCQASGGVDGDRRAGRGHRCGDHFADQTAQCLLDSGGFSKVLDDLTGGSAIGSRQGADPSEEAILDRVETTDGGRRLGDRLLIGGDCPSPDADDEPRGGQPEEVENDGEHPSAPKDRGRWRDSTHVSG